jgi:V/A-type H+-transporting ATPase subunit D
VIRLPPGRAGRLWLRRRLAIARRGQDALEQKRGALVRQLEEAETLLRETRREWDEAARAAEVWWQRAGVLVGERQLELARETVPARADVTLAWRNALGVVYPSVVSVSLPSGEPPLACGSAALLYTAQAHRRALEAAAHLATAELTRERTARELGATTRRLRALERRWIPEHEQALSKLSLALDETEREDAARVRWVAQRPDARTG